MDKNGQCGQRSRVMSARFTQSSQSQPGKVNQAMQVVMARSWMRPFYPLCLCLNGCAGCPRPVAAERPCWRGRKASLAREACCLAWSRAVRCVACIEPRAAGVSGVSGGCRPATIQDSASDASSWHPVRSKQSIDSVSVSSRQSRTISPSGITAQSKSLRAAREAALDLPAFRNCAQMGIQHAMFRMLGGWEHEDRRAWQK